jgi:hypothetical protein
VGSLGFVAEPQYFNAASVPDKNFYAARLLGMHRISGRPDNPAFFDIRYPTGYQITLPDIRLDIRLPVLFS